MPPYCEQHQMYHDWRDPFECSRMRARACRKAKAAYDRDHAERIARRIADAEWETAPASMTGPEKARRYNATLSTARAAALAALTEKENAR